MVYGDWPEFRLTCFVMFNHLGRVLHRISVGESLKDPLTAIMADPAEFRCGQEKVCEWIDAIATAYLGGEPLAEAHRKSQHEKVALSAAFNGQDVKKRLSRENVAQLITSMPNDMADISAYMWLAMGYTTEELPRILAMVRKHRQEARSKLGRRPSTKPARRSPVSSRG